MKKTTAQIIQDELKKSKLIGLPGKVDGLSGKVDGLSGKVNGLSNKVNGLSNKVDGLSGKVNGLSGKVNTLTKRMDEMADAAKIIRENEQNLKDLGTLKSRLDLLDKIYVTVDKIAGDVTSYRQQQELNSGKLAAHDVRIEKVEKHLHLPAAA